MTLSNLCSAALFLLPHDVLMRQKRDTSGQVVKPHVIVWECQRCNRDVGETALGARWDLLTKLRRQVVAIAYRRRAA